RVLQAGAERAGKDRAHRIPEIAVGEKKKCEPVRSSFWERSPAQSASCSGGGRSRALCEERHRRCARRRRRGSGRWIRRPGRCWTEAGAPCAEPKSSCRIRRSTSVTRFEQRRLRFARHQQREPRNQGMRTQLIVALVFFVLTGGCAGLGGAPSAEPSQKG